MYVCETWSVALQNERRTAVFYKRIVKNMLGMRERERGWRKLHKEKLVICNT